MNRLYSVDPQILDEVIEIYEENKVVMMVFVITSARSHSVRGLYVYVIETHVY
jgi:hypothetical protein